MKDETTHDVQLEDYGSLVAFQPLTETAVQWIEANVTGDTTWWCGALMVETRYANHLYTGMVSDGLEIRS